MASESSVFTALLVLALPFLSFLILALVPPLRRQGPVAGWIGIVAMALALAAALRTWWGGLYGTLSVPWLPGDGGPMALFISGDQLYARTQNGQLFNMDRPTEPLLMVGEELPLRPLAAREAKRRRAKATNLSGLNK